LRLRKAFSFRESIQTSSCCHGDRTSAGIAQERLNQSVADLRMLSFFCKEFDSEYCNDIIRFKRSESKIQKPDLVKAPTLFSGALIGNTMIDIKPLMILDRCSGCGHFHLFNLVKVDETTMYYEWPCSNQVKKTVPLPIASE